MALGLRVGFLPLLAGLYLAILVVLGVLTGGLGPDLVAALDQHFDARLGLFELLAALLREGHTAFEELDGAFEREVAAFEIAHHGLKFGETGFEGNRRCVFGLGILTHVSKLYPPNWMASILKGARKFGVGFPWLNSNLDIEKRPLLVIVSRLRNPSLALVYSPCLNLHFQSGSSKLLPVLESPSNDRGLRMPISFRPSVLSRSNVGGP